MHAKRSKRGCEHTQIEDRLPAIRASLHNMHFTILFAVASMGRIGCSSPFPPMLAVSIGGIIRGWQKANAACLSDVNFETKFILAAQRQAGKLILIFLH
jgi:hypothetical protein